MSDDVVIRVQNVKKDFHLPRHKSNSIKHSVINVFEKKDKTVDVHHALKGVSFDIKKGEFFGVLGRNGSGKSTLLKILAQIYTPTSGKVSHKGKLVPFIELGVGFKPELTGRENVYLNGALLGFSTKEIDERYDEIVAFAELEEFMEQKLKNYSSGMKVRLAFAVATHAEADILLLDEVLAVGDAAFQRKCFDHFKSLKEQKKTIVFVTHSMGSAREYCDRGVLIEDGLITRAGDIDEVADAYLQLFNKPSDSSSSDSGRRWGSRAVYVDHLDVKTANDQLAISVDVKASDSSADGVKFGFRVKDSQGKVIAGANNLNVKGGKKLSFKANEKKTLKYVMPNIFGNGTHRVSTTIKKSNGEICDQWEDAASFSNTKDNVYYPVLCPATLEVIER